MFKKHLRRQLVCEQLERRIVLTNYIVDTLDDSNAADGMISLREALTAANLNAAFVDAPAGQTGANAVDTLSFSTALNGQVISLGELGTLQITESISLSDSNLKPIAIVGNSQQIFNLVGVSGVTISNIVLRDGQAAQGGAIRIGSGSELTLEKVILQSNRGQDGGAIYNDGGNLSISNSTISSNRATAASGSGGGIFSAAGSVTLVNSQLTFNQATRAGGGIEIVNGTLNLQQTNLIANDVNGLAGAPNPGNGGGLHVTGNSAIVNVSGGVVFGNKAGSEGGGLWNQTGSTLNINGAVILRNTAFGNDATNGGGGVFNNGGTVTITGATTTISNNFASGTAGSGGGIFNDAGGIVTVTDATISGNVANRAGGGIEAVAGTTTNLNAVKLNNNNAGVGPLATAAPGNGGGLHITGAGNATITGGEVVGNSAALEGGGLWNGAGTMTITNTLISGNTANGAAADDGGGGIFNNGGTVNITGASLSNNVANGASGSGGGLFSLAGTVTVIGSTLSFNSATRAGGGVEIVNGSLSLTNSNLISNDVNGLVGAANPGNGGGLHVSGNAATITVDGGSVFGNLAGSEGGGLWNQSGSTLTIRNGTLIDANEAFGNDATNGGGGVFNNGGTVTITGATTTISNNFASGTAGSGGGIFNDAGGTVTVADATISGNVANRAGGGIEAVAGTTTNLNAVKLNNNNAGVGPLATAAPGNGGGLHITGAGNVTITGGEVLGNSAALEGGGLWNGAGTMTITNTLISGNTANGAAADDGGGGVFNNGGTVNITGASLSNNVANGANGSGGGLFSLAGTVTVIGSTLSFNSATRAGGGVEIVNGSLSLTNSNLISNDVNGLVGAANPGNGGGLHVSGNAATVTVDGGSVFGNLAGSEGGGLWNQSGSTLTIRNGTLIDANEAFGNDATNGGGGVFNNGGTVTITGATTTISNNFASGTAGSGGGIFNDAGGTVTVADATISGNVANRAGGGIEAVAGTTTNLNAVKLNNNNAGVGPLATAAPGNGGGLHITGAGNVTITGGEVLGNSAALEGGGLWNGAGTLPSSLSLTDVTVANNSASLGGGIFNDAGGTLIVNSSTLSANTATAAGGGLMSEDGDVRVVNSTISGNQSPLGGGIRVLAGNVVLISATITNNVAVTGGGLNQAGGTISVANTIIAGNSAAAGPDGQASITGDNNLIGNSSGLTVSGMGNIVNATPQLGPLQDNGGPTQTHALLAGSPAIDAGNNTVPNLDQRGVSRPQGTGFDIGAFELVGGVANLGTFTVSDADVNGDGLATALDVLMVINVVNGGDGFNLAFSERSDVNQDSFTTALDVLLIVNFINASSKQLLAPSVPNSSTGNLQATDLLMAEAASVGWFDDLDGTPEDVD